MRKLINYLILPKEISAKEFEHVNKINKIALFVAFLHVPVFFLVASLCGTSLVDAAAFSALILAGPFVASKTIKNPRTLSLIFGFTSMCLGALLVHLGQSSVQIEMHFHFFVFLALLAVYGNPMTIIVAAATVALHHLVFYFFLPASVFNYEAAVWVVLLHAVFVVLESIASCFIARNFFDNVIGLEKIVNQRTAELNRRNEEMNLILNNASQGFLNFNMDGSIDKERSAIIETWFGKEAENEKIWDVFNRFQSRSGVLLQLGIEAIIDDFMPLSITIEQLPQRIRCGDLILGCQYKPIKEKGKVKKIMLVASDITALVAAEQYEKEQREIIKVFECMNRDRNGFIDYLTEASSLVGFLEKHATQSQLSDIKRALHTLKGISGVFGNTSIFDLCHQIENRIEECNEFIETDQKMLANKWKESKAKFEKLLGNKESSLDVVEEDIRKLIHMLSDGVDPKIAIATVQSWKYEPTEKRLQRISEQAKGIAERLNKGQVEINIDHNHLRLSQNSWSRFWSSFVHVVRNAVDHGLWGEDENAADNKISLRTFDKEDRFIIEIEDNGRGIDWAAIEKKCQKLGLPYKSQTDLEAALFSDGVSSKNEATEFSGRGVGMGAVKDSCEELGGKVEIFSEENRGTRISFIFPLNSRFESEPESRRVA